MRELKLVLGKYDDPQRQKQEKYDVDLCKNNVAIFGSSMMGKSTLVKTILVRVHQVVKLSKNEADEEIYILDFGNSLYDYKNLLYVIAYFDGTQEENVRRMFNKLEQKYNENVKAMPGRSYLDCPEERRPAHVIFIIDGLNAFMADEKYLNYHEQLQQLARDGLSKGITVIFTANEKVGGVDKLLPSFHSVIAFGMSNNELNELFPSHVEKPIEKKGRGLVLLERGVYEFQACFPYNCNVDDLDDKKWIKQVNASLMNVYGEEESERVKNAYISKRMRVYEGDLTEATWGNYCNTPIEKYQQDTGLTVVGQEYYGMKPFGIDLKLAKTIAIYGKKRSGKTNLLRILIRDLLRMESSGVIDSLQFVIWTDKNDFDEAILGAIEEKGELFSEKKEFENYMTNKHGLGSAANGKSDRMKTPDVRKDLQDIMRSGINTADNGAMMEETGDTTVDMQETNSKYTVFIIQSRRFFTNSSSSYNEQLVTRLAWVIDKKVASGNSLFIFSDAQPFSYDDMRKEFNSFIHYAFLMNDIVPFVKDRGAKTVFETQDIKELKENYGHCELGEGFCLDCEEMELNKIKFLKYEGDE